MKIGIIGGGLTGICAAFELTGAGHEVMLFEVAGQVISKASFVNEGKLHLGLVYAKDPSERTVRRMAMGAMKFRSLILRWVESSAFEAALSSPFYYAVHRNSQVSPEGIETHFKKVEQICSEIPGFPEGYPGMSGDTPLFIKLNQSELACLFNEELIKRVFYTAERSVNPEVIACSLRARIKEFPGLNVHTGCRILRAGHEHHGRTALWFLHEGVERKEIFDAVINSSWENRLGIDETIELKAPRPIIHRYKTALSCYGADTRTTLPSVTFVLGSYGDTVTFRDRNYVSWYPTGHIHTDHSHVPAPESSLLTGIDQDYLIESSLAGLRDLMPRYKEELASSPGCWNIAGGYISAWGQTGIEDPSSQLHERFDIGVTRHGNYFSVDTGKYTTAPLIANEVCRMIQA